MKSHLSERWWVVAIIAVRVIFLPIEKLVHAADKDLHASSWLPDAEQPESVSTCCDDGLCQLWGPCVGLSQINSKVYGPIPPR
jgi:hypothetical protein